MTVPNVTVPVSQGVFERLEGTLAKPDETPRTHGLSLDGQMPVRGRWVLCAMRADYGLGGRTFWLTFRWAGE